MSTSYILFYRASMTSALSSIENCVLRNYGSVEYSLPFINALCVKVRSSVVQTLNRSQDVAFILEDTRVSKCLFPNIIHAKSRLSGKHDSVKVLSLPRQNQGAGTSIAFIDTGLSPHYDFIRNPYRIAAFHDFVNGRSIPYDDDGHGTHVTGIACSNGYCGGRKGDASESSIVALKALDSSGSGNISDILAAMQWVYDNHLKYNIRVVNMSFGAKPSYIAGFDVMELGAYMLYQCGLTVVAAAGNSGPAYNSITSPGTSPFVITVGCYDGHNVSDFSGRGGSEYHNVKPDVVAPGVNILSCCNNIRSGYAEQSGTSMSAPLISALTACLYSSDPYASPNEVKERLLRSATPLKFVKQIVQGSGLIQ